MLPNLSALGPDRQSNGSKRARGPAGDPQWPTQTYLPAEILTQIFDEATLRQESVLITYMFDGEPNEVGRLYCPEPLYSTLSFAELRAMGSAGAARLLRSFQQKLDSVPPGNRSPINVDMSYHKFDGMEGLADELTDGAWSEVGEHERWLQNPQVDPEEAFPVAMALSKQLFLRNRERLSRLLSDKDSYPYDTDELPHEYDAGGWWERFVEDDVNAVEDSEGYYEPSLVDEDKPWLTWDDVRVQHPGPWVREVYNPAMELLMGRVRGASRELPLFVGRIRLTITSRYGWGPYLPDDDL